VNYDGTGNNQGTVGVTPGLHGSTGDHVFVQSEVAMATERRNGPSEGSGKITGEDAGCTVKSAAYTVTGEYREVQPSGLVTLDPCGRRPAMVVPTATSEPYFARTVPPHTAKSCKGVMSAIHLALQELCGYSEAQGWPA
jgi:hypothetical protein